MNVYRRFIPPLPATSQPPVSLFNMLLAEHLRNRKRTMDAMHRVSGCRSDTPD